MCYNILCGLLTFENVLKLKGRNATIALYTTISRWKKQEVVLGDLFELIKKMTMRRRWILIRCCTKLLSLQSRAVVTANAPDRCLARGEFVLESDTVCSNTG
jgi:hypothetical protein